MESRIRKLKFFGTILIMLLAGHSVTAQAVQQQKINWYDFDVASKKASEKGDPLLLFMEAEWCGICKRMHREVFTDSGIQSMIQDHFQPVRIDIESEAELSYQGKRMSQKAFSQLMKIKATPTILFIQSNHTVIGSHAGFLNSEEFSTLLAYIHTKTWQKMTYEEYVNSK